MSIHLKNINLIVETSQIFLHKPATYPLSIGK